MMPARMLRWIWGNIAWGSIVLTSRSRIPGIPVSRFRVPGIPVSRSRVPGIPASRSRVPSVLPRILCLALLAWALSWPGVSYARDAFAPGEVIVRYRQPVAWSGTADRTDRTDQTDQTDQTDRTDQTGLSAPGQQRAGRPPSLGEHAAPSLSQLDRKFGLLKAEHPRERLGERDRRDIRDPRDIKDKRNSGAGAGQKALTLSQSAIPNPQSSILNPQSPIPNSQFRISNSSWRVLSFPPGADAKAIAAAYSKDPNVAFAEPNYIGSLGYVPTDPAYAGKQKSMYDRLHLGQAWDILRADSAALAALPSVIVAVIDSGVDVNHPDLAGAIAPGEWDFADGDASVSDDLGHGTRVAGIIAAAENAQGGVGAAFGCRILPFDVTDSRGQVRVADMAAAIEEAVAQGAGVINLSLTFRFDSQLLREACAAASESAVVVAAGGS